MAIPYPIDTPRGQSFGEGHSIRVAVPLVALGETRFSMWIRFWRGTPIFVSSESLCLDPKTRTEPTVALVADRLLPLGGIH